MIAVVTYLWGTKYHAGHVQRLARSVKKWLAVPHQFVCITDEAVPGVKTMRNPAPQFPKQCYRRLWLFSKEAVSLGDGVLHFDLDVVICGPLDAFITDADFQIYRAGSIAARGYSLNPSVFWLRPGTQADIWKRFRRNPRAIASAAKADGFWGSDQAVISHLRRDVDVPTFGDADGLISYRQIRHAGWTAPPPGTRIVSFHGKRTPFEREVQAEHPWIRLAWSEAA